MPTCNRHARRKWEPEWTDFISRFGPICQTWKYEKARDHVIEVCRSFLFTHYSMNGGTVLGHQRNIWPVDRGLAHDITRLWSQQNRRLEHRNRFMSNHVWLAVSSTFVHSNSITSYFSACCHFKTWAKQRKHLVYRESCSKHGMLSAVDI